MLERREESMREGRVGSIVVLLFLSVLIATIVVTIKAEEEYVLLATLHSPDPEGSDGFGGYISLGEDILAIGDWYAEVDGVSGGILYIYDRSWDLSESLRAPSPRSFQVFGASIDARARGSHL